MRTILASPERVRGPVACLAAALVLSACSADVTRFDFPAFSLGHSEEEKKSIPAPPEPINQYEKSNTTAAWQDQPSKPEYKVAQANNGVTRSNLGRPADDVDDYRYSGNRDSQGSTRSPLSGTNQFTTVQPGDTLYGISRRTGVSVARIKEANNLYSDNIRVGQRLIVPGASSLSDDVDYGAPRARRYNDPDTTASANDRLQLDDRSSRNTVPLTPGGSNDTGYDDTYRVQPGDSLYGISRKLGVSANQLADINGITDPTRLRIGQVLRIPGRSSGSYNRSSTSYDRGQSVPSSGYRGTSAYESNNGITRDRSLSERRVASTDQSAGLGGSSYAGSSALSSETNFRWPVRGRIISRFGGQTPSGMNDGINVAVPEGTSVKAVEDGVVAYAGNELKGYGNLVLVRHSNDWVSAYAHNSQLLVRRGDEIRRGQIIAKAGRTGSVDRPQVHFELRKGSKPVDPLKHLASY